MVSGVVTFLEGERSFLSSLSRAERLIYSCTLQPAYDYRARRRIGTENNLRTSNPQAGLFPVALRGII